MLCRNSMKDNRMKIETENELHYEIVKFIRKNYPEALMIAGLGENQRTPGLRISSWKKGYSAGQVDLMLMNPTKKYNSLCLEFKSPTGKRKLSDQQLEMKKKYLRNRCKYICSNSYSEILLIVIKHLERSKRYLRKVNTW